MVYYPNFTQCLEKDIFCNWNTGWGTITIAAMLVVFFFYVIVYMVSYGLHLEELKRSAKSRLLDALFTAILAVLLIVIMSSVFSAVQLFLSGGTVRCDMYGTIQLSGLNADPFQLIECKLTEKASYLSSLYERLYVAAREPFKRFGLMWGLFGMPIYMQGAYINDRGLSALYSEIEGYRLLTHMCVMLLIVLNGYLGSVHYISSTMLTMFLPVGIVLRAIPFTRGIGAFFISLALGFYIIFPLLFVITDPTFVRVQGTYMDISDASSIVLPWPSFKGAVSLITLGAQSQSTSLFFGSVNVRDAAAELSKLYYGLLLQPVVILSITLVFVRYLTTLLGGESQEIYRLAAKVI